MLTQSYKSHQLGPTVDQSIKKLSKRVTLIEKRLNSPWVNFHKKVESLNIPFIKSSEKEDQLQTIIAAHYYSFYNVLHQLEAKRLNILKWGSLKAEEWSWFNKHICNNYFPSSSDMVKRFKDRMHLSFEKSKLLELELKEYEGLLNELTKESLISIRSINFLFSIFDRKYQWKKVFLAGLATEIIGAEKDKFDKYIPLPDLYFYHMGIVYGEYYKVVKVKFEKNQNVRSDIFNEKKKRLTNGQLLLLCEHLGILQHLRKKLQVEAYTKPRFLAYMVLKTKANKSTLCEVLRHLNVGAADYRAIAKNNPRDRIANYNVLIDYMTEKGRIEVVHSLQAEKEIRIGLRLLNKKKTE